MLAGRLDKQVNPKILVKWQNIPSCENSWELLEKFQEKFPDFHLEDKVLFEGGRVDEDFEPKLLKPNRPEINKVYVRKRFKKRGAPEVTSEGDAGDHNHK